MGVHFGKSSGEDIGLRDGNDSDLGNFGGTPFQGLCSPYMHNLMSAGMKWGCFCW